MFIHFAGVKNSPTNQRTRYKLARKSCFSFDRAPLVKTGHTVNMVLFHLQTRVMGSDSGRRQSKVLIVMLAAKSPIKSIKKITTNPAVNCSYSYRESANDSH